MTKRIPPARFRKAVVAEHPEFLGPEFGGALSEWLRHAAPQWSRGGDKQGRARFNWEILNLENCWPQVADLRAALLEHVDEFCEQLDVPEFDVTAVETILTLYHNGSHFAWHNDSRLMDGVTLADTRRITFCYYMHKQPRMFTGGELEFMDGTAIEPTHDKLVVFHPFQQHRIRRVQCFDADALAGRFAVMGWIHGAPTDDWSALGERLCPVK